jgi:hypothetical protein
MNRQRSERGVRSLSGATVLLALAAGAATAQPVPVRLTDGVQPPTRVLPGDEIVMTVFDPVLFPAGGRWTIAGRSVDSGRETADGTYQLAFHAPGDFPRGWEALPIEYVDPQGRLLYDSRSDMRDAVGLANIADPTALVEARGRLTGASARAHLGGRFCVCGFFPHRRSWEGLAVDGRSLGMPVTASGTELWFDVPETLSPGVHEIAVDPGAGFADGERASIAILSPEQGTDGPVCPCAEGNKFLSQWAERPPPPANVAAATTPAVEPLLWLESLGGSTGEVFRAHVVSSGAGPIEIDGLFAVEPVSLSSEERDRILESVRQAAGSHVEVQANFYCLQFGAAAPPEGIVYRIAPQSKQQTFQPAARALAAARRLHDAGSLSPDTSPESYFHSIRQWSVWTLEQGFDRDGFLAAFLEHTRKNVEDAGQEWSDEFADAVRRSAEGRWKDITKVLGDAGLDVASGG